MEPDQVTDVVHSNALFPHGGPTQNGFAFLCSDEAVAGCKKAAGRQSLVEHTALSDEGRSQVSALLEHCQFEVPFSELQSVEMHRAHKLRPGEIIVRTGSAEHKSVSQESSRASPAAVPTLMRCKTPSHR